MIISKIAVESVNFCICIPYDIQSHTTMNL